MSNCNYKWETVTYVNKPFYALFNYIFIVCIYVWMCAQVWRPGIQLPGVGSLPHDLWWELQMPT